MVDMTNNGPQDTTQKNQAWATPIPSQASLTTWHVLGNGK
jgi:hypothetical protein